jgi:hypothetical protein
MLKYEKLNIELNTKRIINSRECANYYLRMSGSNTNRE